MRRVAILCGQCCILVTVILWLNMGLEQRIVHSTVGKFGTEDFNKDDCTSRRSNKQWKLEERWTKSFHYDQRLLYYRWITLEYTLTAAIMFILWLNWLFSQNWLRLCLTHSKHNQIQAITHILKNKAKIAITLELSLTKLCPPPGCCSADDSPVEQRVERAPGFHQ